MYPTHTVTVDGNPADGVRPWVNHYRSLHPSSAEVYAKINWYIDNTDNYTGEVQILQHLAGSGFTPQLIDHEILAEVQCVNEDGDDTGVYYITLIRMVRLPGESLMERYIPPELHADHEGPGSYVAPDDFDIEDIRECLPAEYIPTDIFEKVTARLRELADNYGVYHEDIHPGNFMEYQGDVYVIDFDNSLYVAK